MILPWYARTVIMDARKVNGNTNLAWLTNKALATPIGRRENVINCAKYRVQNWG